VKNRSPVWDEQGGIGAPVGPGVYLRLWGSHWGSRAGKPYPGRAAPTRGANPSSADRVARRRVRCGGHRHCTRCRARAFGGRSPCGSEGSLARDGGRSFSLRTGRGASGWCCPETKCGTPSANEVRLAQPQTLRPVRPAPAVRALGHSVRYAIVASSGRPSPARPSPENHPSSHAGGMGPRAILARVACPSILKRLPTIGLVARGSTTRRSVPGA
jgi:hypothetical protein